MKLSHAGVLAASFLGTSLIFSPLVTASNGSPSGGHHPGHGHPGSGQLDLPATTACIEASVSLGRANGVLSGIAAAVVLDGRIDVPTRLRHREPNVDAGCTADDAVQVGSITKVMTATATLSLAEEHRLHLHAPVNYYLPGLSLPGEPGWTEQLTPHLLLSHQGGLYDRITVNGPRDDSALRTAFYDPAYTSTVPFNVAPGTFYSYSNPNFMLAGLVAEDAAGRPYREVIRRRVFKPLGMTRSTFLPSEVLADTDVASGVRGGIVLVPDAYDNAIERPAGFAWTSVEDLAKLSLFVLRGNRAVLSDRSWRLLQSPKVNTYQFLDRQSYAYGLLVQNGGFLRDASLQNRFYDGLKMVGHDGAIWGYKSFMMTLPRRGFGYVAVVNGDAPGPATDLFRCFQVAAFEAVGDRLPAPSPAPDPQIQRDRFGDYVGTFLDRTGMAGRYVLSLTPAGDLWIDLPDVPSNFQYDHKLLPNSRDNFYLLTQAGAIPITGFRGEGSEVLYLRARPFAWTRVEEGATALRSAAASVNVDELTKAIRDAALEDGSLRWTTP